MTCGHTAVGDLELQKRMIQCCLLQSEEGTTLCLATRSLWHWMNCHPAALAWGQQGKCRVTHGAGAALGRAGQHTLLPSWHRARDCETGPAGPHPSSCQAGKAPAPCSSSPLHIPCPLPCHRCGQPRACQMTSSLAALRAV